MPQTVSVVMTAQNARLVQAWLESQKAVENYSEAVQRTGRRGQSAGAQIARGWQNIHVDIGRATLSMLGLGGATQAFFTTIQVIRAEFEAMEQFRSRLIEPQAEFGAAIRRFRRTAFGTPEEIQTLVEEVRASTAPIPKFQLMEFVAEAISAGASPEQFMQFGRGAIQAAEELPEFADRPEVLRQLGIGQTVIQESFRQEFKDVKDAGIAITAMLTKFSGVLPGGLENFGESLKNQIPAMRTMSDAGFTFSETLTNLAALQTKAFDVEAASTRTMIVNNLMGTIPEVLQRVGAPEFINQGQAMLDFIRGSDPRAVQARNILLGPSQDELARMAAERGVSVPEMLEGMARGEITGTLRTRARTRQAAVEFFGGQISDLPGAKTVPQFAEDIARVLPQRLNEAVDLARRDAELRSAEELASFQRDAERRAEAARAQPGRVIGTAEGRLRIEEAEQAAGIGGALTRRFASGMQAFFAEGFFGRDPLMRARLDASRLEANLQVLRTALGDEITREQALTPFVPVTREQRERAPDVKALQDLLFEARRQIQLLENEIREREGKPARVEIVGQQPGQPLDRLPPEGQLEQGEQPTP